MLGVNCSNRGLIRSVGFLVLSVADKIQCGRVRGPPPGEGIRFFAKSLQTPVETPEQTRTTSPD